MHVPVTLPAGEETLYPQNRRTYGPQSRTRRFAEEVNLLPLPGIEPVLLGHPSRRLVVTSTALYRLFQGNKINKLKY